MTLPTGTLTFLFTDVQGSTALWELAPQAMPTALARHDALATAVIEQHDGLLVKARGEGDSLFAVFSRATDAAQAALSLQHAFSLEAWPAETPLLVRVALHTGEVQLRDGDYYGQAVNRAARLRALGHGGQTLLSQTTYDIVRDTLPQETCLRDLGEQRLRDLSRPERVFQLWSPGLRDTFPPLRSLDALPNNLPRQLTSFVGREVEIAQVSKALDGTCLLTLTGAGGSGKSRLSLQVAADRLDGFPNGVWLVELAPVSDPALVAQTIASATGLREASGQALIQTLTEAWKEKRLLLILDNCEHLIDACAQLADTLLRACPHVTILATSREPLNVPGETTWRVPTLSLPSVKPPLPPFETLNQYEAVRLFVDRAVSVLPTFAITSGNAPAVAQICSRLDGIPLAIELAAARVKVLPPEQIVQRLDDRFRLLTGGSRTVLPRQQTLRALLDWSYDLLPDQEKTLLSRLSFLAGSWSLKAAEAVCSGDGIEDWEVMDLLSHLVDKSLVVTEEQDGLARYRLLETVRQYASDRLRENGQGAELETRLVGYCLALSEEAGSHMAAGEEDVWVERLEPEHDTIRTALNLCAGPEGDGQAGLRLVAPLHLFYYTAGYAAEGRRRCAKALAHDGAAAPTAARAAALMAAGVLAATEGDTSEARGLLEEAVALCRETGNLGPAVEALHKLSNIATESDVRRRLLEECLALALEIGDRHGAASAIFQIGTLAEEDDDLDSARRLFTESIGMFQEMGDNFFVSLVMHCLGSVLMRMGEVEAGEALKEKAFRLKLDHPGKFRRAVILLHHSIDLMHHGDYEAAYPLLQSSLIILRSRGNSEHLGQTLELLAWACNQRGDFEAARSFAEESVGVLREAGSNSLLSWALFRLGDAERGVGLDDFAARHYSECLSLSYTKLGGMGIEGVTASLTGLVSLAGRSGKADRAARLWGIIDALNTQGHFLPVWLNRQMEQMDRDERSLLRSELGEKAYAARLAEGHAMTLEQAVKYALGETGN